ncbi:late cornified envelope protein 7A-like [Balaenoptera acutorostrata]|uniref:Late cornified envelope protein 7A-like n=1 Tax=Balaenoptera acutorostrata TaxID=9767 RepID=A0ABM3U5N0_BALAC|nr:late cornified envelope protein 7A-like [Balaenoptera acutorostrata]
MTLIATGGKWKVQIAVCSGSSSQVSCQQNQQKCQLPAKCLPKYPPKHPPKAPQALAPCPPPAPSCCVPSCCISGFGSCCSLVSHRFPSVYLCQPQPSNCCEVELSGCSSCCHGFGGYS